MHKILTLDNLYQFFVKQNKSVNFSSKEKGNPIVVSTPANFEISDNDMPGMLKLKFKVCHTETNRNGSHISEQNMKTAMPTLKYRPVLAYIHQLSDGTYDFYAHNMEIEEDENGEEKINYIEKQVGCFTADDPYLEYDEEKDKTYVNAYAVIPEEYTEAANIIRRKNGTKVSCELVIDELSYNAKEKYLDLTSFYFGGCTLLGCDENGNEIGEGMLGARADITDFCHEKPVFNYQEKLVEILGRLDNTLSNFNKNNTKEGVRKEMNHFEELLEKYGFTAEELDFDYANMPDDELDVAFEEFKNKKYADDGGDAGSDTGDGSETDPGASDGEGTGSTDTEPTDQQPADPEPTEDEDSEDGDDSSDDDEPKKKFDNFVKTFKIEISHEDIRYALYNLLGEYEENDNEWYGIYSVYDDYFVMQGWCSGKFYKQGYSIDGDNVSLDGERTELFQMLLTESEKIAVDKLRDNYAELEEKYNELKTFKDNYDTAEIKAKKDEIFANEVYDGIRESDEFKTLVNDAEKYSVEEIQDKCDLLFAANEKKIKFAAKDKKSHSISFNFNKKEDKKVSAYGNLFKND
mgnify:FL=1|nr:MAG TPA: hypothetical protein [Caudoviricetes sp.]